MRNKLAPQAGMPIPLRPIARGACVERIVG